MLNNGLWNSFWLRWRKQMKRMEIKFLSNRLVWFWLLQCFFTDLYQLKCWLTHWVFRITAGLLKFFFSHHSSNLSSIVLTLFWNSVEFFQISVFSLDYTPKKCKIHNGKENPDNKGGSPWWKGQCVISMHLKLSCSSNYVPKEYTWAISVEVTQFFVI